MESLFVTGTDTDVGKTYVAAGLAASLRRSGADVGVMKPFAAGTAQKSGPKSEDAEILARAAGCSDPEELVNPQFFPIPASPYTAQRELGTEPDVGLVLSSFKRIAGMHDVVVVEGMGGVMTPIHREYCVADLIRDMRIPALIVTSSRIGAVNHCVLTVGACKRYGIPVRGIVINTFEGGYEPGALARDLEDLLGVPVLGALPRVSMESLHDEFARSIDLEKS